MIFFKYVLMADLLFQVFPSIKIVSSSNKAIKPHTPPYVQQGHRLVFITLQKFKEVFLGCLTENYPNSLWQEASVLFGKEFFGHAGIAQFLNLPTV